MASSSIQPVEHTLDKHIMHEKLFWNKIKLTFIWQKTLKNCFKVFTKKNRSNDFYQIGVKISPMIHVRLKAVNILQNGFLSTCKGLGFEFLG